MPRKLPAPCMFSQKIFLYRPQLETQFWIFHYNTTIHTEVFRDWLWLLFFIVYRHSGCRKSMSKLCTSPSSFIYHPSLKRLWYRTLVVTKMSNLIKTGMQYKGITCRISAKGNWIKLNYFGQKTISF